MVEDCRVPCIASFGKGFFEFSPKMKRSAWLLLACLALFSVPFAGTCAYEMGSTARFMMFFALELGMLVAPFTIINRRLALLPLDEHRRRPPKACYEREGSVEIQRST